MQRILILSYYFYPSAEVGAKRVSELACHLRDEGWQVTVLTAPSAAVPELAARVDGMELLTLAPPPKLYPLLAYWPKRLLRARARHRDTRTPPGGQARVAPVADTRDPEAGPRESPFAWFKRHYHALELMIDDRKLWSFQVLLRALWMRRRFDWILSSGPVHSVHLSARVLAGTTGARWIMDLRDPWVCNHFWPEQHNSKSLFRDHMERFLERGSVERADRVTVAAPGIGKALCARVPTASTKLHVVLNGYDGRVALPAQPAGRLRLLYAGSLYLNRNPFPLLDALRDLVSLPTVDRSRVGFTLVGQCTQWNGRNVGDWIDAAGMHDVVQVLPAVSPAEAGALMQRAEVLVNFAQGQPEQIPAKVYDYMVSGREMLLIAESDSDAARITRESGAGRIVDPRDPAALHTIVRELYTFYVERRLSYAPDAEFIGRFSREHQNRRFSELLDGSLA